MGHLQSNSLVLLFKKQVPPFLHGFDNAHALGSAVDVAVGTVVVAGEDAVAPVGPRLEIFVILCASGNSAAVDLLVNREVGLYDAVTADDALSWVEGTSDVGKDEDGIDEVFDAVVVGKVVAIVAILLGKVDGDHEVELAVAAGLSVTASSHKAPVKPGAHLHPSSPEELSR